MDPRYAQYLSDLEEYLDQEAESQGNDEPDNDGVESLNKIDVKEQQMNNEVESNRIEEVGDDDLSLAEDSEEDKEIFSEVVEWLGKLRDFCLKHYSDSDTDELLEILEPIYKINYFPKNHKELYNLKSTISNLDEKF